MEFNFSVNDIFNDEITIVDEHFQPRIKARNDGKQNFKKCIDDVGAASAKAQSLHGPITSAIKLAHTDHRLYVLKDANDFNGKGSLVGILKVGVKKLFVFDRSGGQNEVEPLCVLDFYVHESRQRMGCGKKLFEYMLKKENIKPVHLAIDRPSEKFTSFLKKHYRLKATIPQVNHYVIFDGFFTGRPAKHKAPKFPYIPPEQNSPINAITNKEREALKDFHISSSYSGSSDQSLPSTDIGSYSLLSQRMSNFRPSRLDSSASQILGAKVNMYSRHMESPDSDTTSLGISIPSTRGTSTRTGERFR